MESLKKFAYNSNWSVKTLKNWGHQKTAIKYLNLWQNKWNKHYELVNKTI